MKINLKLLLEELSNSNNGTTNVKILRKHFPNKRKNWGSARVVIPINNKWVLKVAYNQKGYAQNEVEKYVYRDSSNYQRRYLAKILKSCPYNTWVMQEKVNRISCSKGEQILKILKNENQFKTILLNHSLHIHDLDQMGMVNKRFKIYDYGYSTYVARQYYQ